MKKVLIILFTLFLLVACSQTKGYSKLTDGSDVIYKKNDKTFTKNDLYEILKVSSESSIENDIITKIANKMDLDLTEANENAQNEVDYYVSIYGEDTIVYQYGSLEAFKAERLYNYLLDELTKVYIDENYDKFVKEDKPIEMQVVHFEDSESATNLIAQANQGKDFDTAAENCGYTESVETKIYLDSNSDLPLEVKNYINASFELGVSEIINVENSTTDENNNTTTTMQYYVVNVINRDVDKEAYILLKKEYVDIQDTKNYFIEKHDIKFYDQSIYELMKQSYEVFE